MNVSETMKNFSNKKRDAYAHLARLAESAERYNDMCNAVCHMGLCALTELTPTERHLFTSAYKYVISNLRAGIEVFKSEGKSQFSEITSAYREELERNVFAACVDALYVTKLNLMKISKSTESQIYFVKQIADYYRYMAECTVYRRDNTKPLSACLSSSKTYQTFCKDCNKLSFRELAEKSKNNYTNALKLAEEELPCTNPVRMSVVLNYSVALRELIGDKVQSVKLAQSAFNEAIGRLDDLDDDMYKDSTLIMQLLRDNITVWCAK